jgi:hypothetical protein
MVCLFLVLTTGMFFNKVNQAESLDCNPAPLRRDGVVVKGAVQRYEVPDALPILGASERVVQHCDLSVTTSGGQAL